MIVPQTWIFVPQTKFVYDALSATAGFDQAANLCEVLAWSLSYSRVFDPPDLYEVELEVPKIHDNPYELEVPKIHDNPYELEVPKIHDNPYELEVLKIHDNPYELETHRIHDGLIAPNHHRQTLICNLPLRTRYIIDWRLNS